MSVGSYVLTRVLEVRGLPGMCSDFTGVDHDGRLDVVELGAGRFGFVETRASGGQAAVSSYFAVDTAPTAERAVDQVCGSVRVVRDFIASPDEVVLVIDDGDGAPRPLTYRRR